MDCWFVSGNNDKEDVFTNKIALDRIAETESTLLTTDFCLILAI